MDEVLLEELPRGNPFRVGGCEVQRLVELAVAGIGAVFGDDRSSRSGVIKTPLLSPHAGGRCGQPYSDTPDTRAGRDAMQVIIVRELILHLFRDGFPLMREIITW
jgi:hypothetical protein